MVQQIIAYSFVTLVGIGAASAVDIDVTSSPAEQAVDGALESVPATNSACQAAGPIGGPTGVTSMPQSPYWCICCDASGDARCCSKCG